MQAFTQEFQGLSALGVLGDFYVCAEVFRHFAKFCSILYSVTGPDNSGRGFSKYEAGQPVLPCSLETGTAPVPIIV